MLSKTFLKRITHAHSWLGLIISGLLFVVFYCGSIALYRAEINEWAVQPHFSFAQGEQKSVSDIMEIAITGQEFDAKEHLTLLLPSKETPYYRAYVDVFHVEGEEDHVTFLIDPVSGEKLVEGDKFFLAEFIYKLHYDLNFSAGSYIIGFVTLVFFFALVSGIFIHAKKLVTNFFKYRTEQNKRSKLLDMHNVIGVMSLPFTLMYAISGLIFNLVIIYQIAFALVLYKGDQQALLDDAGYVSIQPQWQEKPWKNVDIDQIYKQIASRENYQPTFVRMYNYGDESAVIHVGGGMAQQIGGRFDVATELTSLKETVINDPINTNMVRKGLQVVANLHFGNYAGFDLRLLYFILGIAVCILIVAGNLLWLDKYSRQRESSAKVLRFTRQYTLVSTVGVILATAVAFLLERVLPIDMHEREQVLIYGFIGGLCLSVMAAYLTDDMKTCLANVLKISAFIGIVLVCYDLVFFFNKITELAMNGQTNSAWTDLVILLLSVFCLRIANALTKKEKELVMLESQVTV
jgi:uncharacterized iron-regulated membrane protein